LAFAAGYKPPFYIAPFAIGLIIIFGLQAYFKNKVSGLIMACLLGLINFYFLLAMIDEYNEMPASSAVAMQMLLVGLSIFAVNFVMAIVMGYKYGSDFGSSDSDKGNVPSVIR
jgi:hypothetical protein